MTINLQASRLGILTTPITPLWTGLVVSYISSTTAFTLNATTVSGTISLVTEGLFLDVNGEQIRIKTVTDNGGGSITFTVAENPFTFVMGQTLNVYNVRYPTTKFQRLLVNFCEVTGDTSNRITTINIYGVTDNNSEVTADGHRLYYRFYSTGKIIFYPDSDRDDGNKVARCLVAVGASRGIEQRNNSGINGNIAVASIPGSDEVGYVDIISQRIFKDYFIAYTDLGATQTDQSHAEQKPVPVVTPECAILELDTNQVFDASKSYATYWGYPGASTSRVQATINTTGYAWDGGADSTITGASNHSTVTIKWTTAGFRYLKLTITDSNGTTSLRYIPIWVGLSPTATIATGDQCGATWSLNKGWQTDLEIQSPPTILRHSLVVVYDLDTLDPALMGFIWPASIQYNFELNTLKFTVLSDYAYLQECYHYPFIVTGSKGDPIDWAYLDMSSTARLVNYLLQWHSNYTEIGNAQYDAQVASIPTAGAAEDVLEYIRDFVAGTIFDQLEFIANSGMRTVYGGPLGGFMAIPDWLHESSISTSDANLVSLSLGTSEVYEPVEYTKGVPTISDIRLSGWYYDSSLNFFPTIARSPAHPAQWGKPFELGGMIATSTTQMMLWAGREMAIRNNADTYTVRPRSFINPNTYQMLDISGQPRVVVRSSRLTFNQDAMGWEQELEGLTFGVTADATLEPYNPPAKPGNDLPDPKPKPILDPPQDIVVLMTKGHVGVSLDCIDFVAAGHPENTTWSEARPTAFVGTAVMFDMSPSGEAWLITTYPTDQTQAGLWYCSNISVVSPSWSLIKTMAQVTADAGGAGYLEAICVDPATNTAYAPVSAIAGGYGAYYYYTVTGGVATFHSNTFNPGPGSGGHYEGTRYACCWDAANNRPLIAASAMGFGVDCSIANMITGTVISGKVGITWPQNTYNVSPNYGMISNFGTGDIAPVTDLTEPGYDGTHNSSWPMFEKDGHLFWLKSTTGNLMIDHVIQAIPNDSLPTLGVFSTSGATGGGFSCGDTYGTIFWAAYSAHASNSYKDIAMTQNGGVTWLDITGNWNTAIATYDGGVLDIKPVIKWTVVPAV